jgi:hypothetical protein
MQQFPLLIAPPRFGEQGGKRRRSFSLGNYPFTRENGRAEKGNGRGGNARYEETDHVLPVRNDKAENETDET